MATDVLAPVGEDRPEAEGLAAAGTVGHSAARRYAGLTGQYAVLVLLAAVVLFPVFFAFIQALSPPIKYLDAGKPFHPVAVQWQHRTWWSGGPASVVFRTLLVALILAWMQIRGAGGTVRTPKVVLTPRRFAAVVAGTVALGVTTSPLFGSLYHHTGHTALWVVVAVVVLAATQVIGLWDPDRDWWRVVMVAGFAALGIVAVAVIAVGAAAWTQAWTSGRLGASLGRSLTMAVLITALQVVTSVMAAYAFAFLRFPFRRVFFLVIMATLLMPLEVTLAGNVALIRQLHWINSMQALVLPFGATAFGTFLILQGFRGIPPEIQDATRLDGYGHISFMWRFAVPLTRPVVAAFTVISALGAWNQYLWPRSVIDSDSANTMQIQLRTLVTTNIGNSNITVAGALVAALPVVLLLIAFQKQIIRGLTAGAVK